MKLAEKIAEIFPKEEQMADFLLEHTCRRAVSKNEIISRNGSHNRNVYFVEKGLMRSFYYENGKDITTNFYIEGQIVANIDTLFRNQETRYNIETLENSEIVFCDFDILEKICGQSLLAANFSRYILGNLMSQMAERIASLQYMTARERYHALLKDNPDIVLRAPLGMIASYLGISPETLSRIRSGR